MRLEAGLGRLLGLGFEVIDSGNAVEDVELQMRIVAQELGDFYEPSWIDYRPWVDCVELFAGNGRAEAFFEEGNDFRGVHRLRPLPHALAGLARSLVLTANSLAFSGVL